MAYFTRKTLAVVVGLLRFPAIVPGKTLQMFACKGGERAGFMIVDLTSDGGSTSLRVSQVYDCSQLPPTLKGTISVVEGMDLTGGLFTSGCFPDGDPTDSDTTFSKVDYT